VKRTSGSTTKDRVERPARRAGAGRPARRRPGWRGNAGTRRRRVLAWLAGTVVVAALAVLLCAGPLPSVRDGRVDRVATLPAAQAAEAAGLGRR